MTGWGMTALLSLALLQSGCGSEEGKASSTAMEAPLPERALTASLGAHQNTLTYTIINLTTWTNRLRRMIEAGDREEAVESYLHARGWLGRIEPVLSVMPAVSAPLLDPGGTQGFPRIERGLREGRLPQLRHLMKGFHRHMERLRVRVEHAGLQAGEVPGLASDALRALGPLTPNRQTLPGLPVIRAAANLEGTKALFLAFSPALRRDPDLREELRSSYRGIFRTLQRMEGKSGDPERSELSSPATQFPEFERRPGRWGPPLSGQVDRLAQLFEEASRLEGEDG